MNTRRFSYGLLLTFAAAVVAGCGENPPPEAPPQPTAAPTAEAAPTPAPAETAAPAATPAPTAAAEAAPAPAPVKTAKEKIVGSKFVGDLSADQRSAAEAEAKKKFAKEKDTKKADAFMKTKADEAAQKSIDVTADTLVYSEKGKPVHTVKFEVSKDDPNALVLKFGKEETGKRTKDWQGKEVTINVTGDDTVTMVDPFAKDPAKAATLTFKRSGAASAPAATDTKAAPKK